MSTTDVYTECATKLLQKLQHLVDGAKWGHDDFIQTTANLLRQELNVDSELFGRLRRIETKLHKVGEAVGAETTMTPTLAVAISNGRPCVQVPGYDVTLTMVRRACEAAQVESGQVLFLLHGTTLLGTLQLTNRK